MICLETVSVLTGSSPLHAGDFKLIPAELASSVVSVGSLSSSARLPLSTGTRFFNLIPVELKLGSKFARDSPRSPPGVCLNVLRSNRWEWRFEETWRTIQWPAKERRHLLEMKYGHIFSDSDGVGAKSRRVSAAWTFYYSTVLRRIGRGKEKFVIWCNLVAGSAPLPASKFTSRIERFSSVATQRLVASAPSASPPPNCRLTLK